MIAQRANRQNFNIVAGEARTLNLVAKQDGAVKDITGETISFRMGHKLGNAPTLTKTGTIVSAGDGTYTVSLTSADTDDLGGEFYYRVYFTSAEEVYTAGRIWFDRGVPSS